MQHITLNHQVLYFFFLSGDWTFLCLKAQIGLYVKSVKHLIDGPVIVWYIEVKQKYGCVLFWVTQKFDGMAVWYTVITVINMYLKTCYDNKQQILILQTFNEVLAKLAQNSTWNSNLIYS